MTEALVFSISAAHRFEAGIPLSPKWTETFTFADVDAQLAAITYGNIEYVFRPDEVEPANSIIIRIQPNKLFSCFTTEDSKLEALRRSVKAGILALERGGQLPDYWRPYSAGKFITFQAQSLAKGDQRRLVMERGGVTPNAFATIFEITRNQKEFKALVSDQAFYDKALRGRASALAQMPKSSDAVPLVGPTTLDLEPLQEQVDTVVHGWKLPFLYESRLTKRQRAFVDVELDRSVRLKGAAGTGKTLAMVAKFLREASLRKAAGTPFRFLFLTHNSSAAELALDYAMVLDSEDIIYSGEPNALKVDTLLSLAVHDLAEDLTDLQPISSDAYEGKKLQLIVLSDTITGFREGAWVTFKRQASEAVQLGIDAQPGSPTHEEFCWDVANEIACVLDADGVRDNQIKREGYIKENRRPQYLMKLETQLDREIVLALYDLYRSSLRKEGLISVDQLVADYLGYLDSFRWDARRNRLGYDAIFVDEYHLFNRTERATFPALLRKSSQPVILMAIDPRQSPKAVFLDAAFGGPDQGMPLVTGQAKHLYDFEFNEVFRYTPEIATFLSFVNHQFPETDLSEEWLPGLAMSVLPNGSKPVASQHPDQQSLYDQAFATALELKKTGPKGNTAVITLSRRSFEVISRAGRYGDKIYVVDSRESLNRLQYVGGRVVFSMPEYVAGVQFDHVLLADANDLDDIGRSTSLIRIRFGSNLYLAASRARKSISIFANMKYGGFAQAIKRAIDRGIVEAKESVAP